MYTTTRHITRQYLHASAESGGATKEVLYNITTPDFTKLVADSHLTQEEARIMRELYESKKANITLAIKGQLKDFIIKDYGEANKQYLGGSEGVMALQKILGVEPDGSFGPDTFMALIEYQGKNGLKKDGIAGYTTIKKLGLETKKDSSVKNTVKLKLTHSLEIPKKDVGEILNSFQIKLDGIHSSLSDVKRNRDENTGFFNVLADDLVSLAGGESGKAIYERSNQNIKNQASDMINSLNTTLVGIPFTDTERSQYLRIRNELEKTLGYKLGEPNVLTTIKNSVMDTPATVVNAVKGTTGVVAGAAEGAYGTLKGALDLTIFATHYTGSFIGEYVGINPDYKNKMDAEIKKIWNMVSGMDFTKDQVLDALSQGFDQIKDDPYAIGKLAGIVIGILLPIKGTGALNGVVRSKKVAAQTAENTVEAAIKLGKPAEIATAKLAVKVATRQANIWKVGEFVLNGPAESAIGAALAKSFQFASGAIRGTTSAKNLKTVEKSIEDFGDAMKNETNLEKLKYIQEAKEALESERDKLAKNIAAKKTTEGKKPTFELEEELAKKKVELAKSEGMARTPQGGSSDGLLANEARLKKEIEALEQKIKEQGGSSAKKQSPGEKSNNPESQPEAKESGIPSNAPKIFDVSGIGSPEGFKKMYRRVAQYYHPDKNAHPDSNNLFKDLKDAYEKNKKGAFIKIAKNPDEYLRHKELTKERV